MSKSKVLTTLALVAALVSFAVPAHAALVMSRTVTGLDSNGWLTPGTTELSFTVTLEYADADAITALAVAETIPAGWSFKSSSGTCTPNLLPAAGTEDSLEFVWFSIPTFPCTFGYTLNVPSSETGPVDVSGKAQYYTSGPLIESNVVTNTIQLEPTTISFTRTLSGAGLSGSSNQFYIPGQPITVDITMTKTGSKAVTALAFSDLVPAGWTIQSTGGANVPNLSPAVGTAGPGPYEFVWFSIPAFPASFQYVIQPPVGSTGEAAFAGTVQFYTDGGLETSSTDDVKLTDAPCLTMTRGGDAFFSPGGVVNITVTLSSTCTDAVTSLGVVETIPAGWSFASSGGTNPPNLAPVVGKEDELEFVWFTIPAFPASFTYSLNVPAGETALSADISGHAIYYLSGGALLTDDVLTTLSGEDTTPPTAVCQDVVVVLDASGNGSVTAAQVDNGSTDDRDTALDLVLSQTAFTCANLGANTVTLTVTDDNSNSDSCDATVTVVDDIAPTAVCQDVTVNLNASGAATVTAAQVNNGSTDNCSIASLVLSQTAFTCADTGANTVTLTVTDAAGNSDTCDATVTVVDNLPPAAVCQNVTVNLNASGAATVTAAQVNNGSTDNCGIASVVLSRTAFTCADVGANTVTLTVTDTAGLTDTCDATVTVVDNLAPTAACQNVTAVLDASGTATVTAAQVDNGSTDNCDVDTLVLSKTDFTCANLGANTVTLTVTDVNGNDSTCNATVTVVDNIAPTAVCRDITVQLDAAGSATITPAQVNNGSDDNCDIASIVLSKEAFTCADLGANTVTMTVADASGNTDSCNATVTVTDVTAPTLTLLGDSTVTVECGDSYTEAGADAQDACDGDLSGDVQITGSVDTGTPATYTLTYSVSDNSGNAATQALRTVVVEDTTDPVITLNGDNPLLVDCSDSYTDAGATVADECDAAATVVETSNNVVPSAPGTYAVVYTATDAAGNQSTATRTVTVGGPICEAGQCEVNAITITSPAAGRVLVADDVTNKTVTLTSEVDFEGPCEIEVTYDVDGVVVGTSTDSASGFAQETNLAAGATHVITATAVGTAEGQTPKTVTTFIEVEIAIGQDANDDGYLDDPFGDLPGDGDQWDAEVDSANCARAVTMVTWFGSATPGAPLTATVTNPANPDQVATVSVPRELLAVGEQGILILAIACDLESLLAPADASEYEDDLPLGAVAGGAYVEVSVIVSADGGATFDELDNALLAGSPITLSLNGLNFTPGLSGMFQSHPSFVNSDTTYGVVLEPETGTWSDAALENVEVDGETLTADATSLSVFGAFEEVALPPTMKVTPNPAFERIVGLVQTGTSVDVTFTVKNIGSGTITGAATLPAGTAGFSLIGTTNYSLQTNQTRQITVRFTPTDEADYTATVTFTGGGDTVTAKLRGTGTAESKACAIFGCGTTEQTSGYGDVLVALLAAASLMVALRLRRA